MGRRTRPWAMPKIVTRTVILKNVWNKYEEEMLRGKDARMVATAPEKKNYKMIIVFHTNPLLMMRVEKTMRHSLLALHSNVNVYFISVMNLRHG